MSVSLIEYRLRAKNSSSSGRGLSRWYEIWEAPFSGRDRRLVARTPAVIGDDEAADERYLASKQDALAMVDGLRRRPA